MASSLLVSPAVVSLRHLAFSTRTTPPQKKHCTVAEGKISTKAIVGGEENESRAAVEIFRTEEAEGDQRRMWKRTESIAAVVEDTVQPGAVLKKTVNAAKRSRGFSFSAAGLLLPYHIGVAQLLIEKGYIRKTIPLAGSSAGAIVSVAIASGISMEELLRATKTLVKDCRQHGTMFRLRNILKATLSQLLPCDAHIKSNERVRVAITHMDNLTLRGWLVDNFDSKEDLIDALLASSFIPGYVAPMPAMVFRNRLCVDGALTFFIPPTCAVHTIGVCAFPGFMGLHEIIGISPECNNHGARATVLEFLNWAFVAASNDVLDRLFQCGYLNATTWAEKNPWEKNKQGQI